MVGITMASMPGEIEAHCAICGAPPEPECPHEGQSLQLALKQATDRWGELERIRDWVLNHARIQVITTFHQLRAARLQAHNNYLATLPYYSVWHNNGGRPPNLPPAQLQLIQSQVQQANQILQHGVDQDWRTSCLRYPEVLDYYFSMVEIVFPSDRESTMRNPRFGAAIEAAMPRRRRDSMDAPPKEHRKKERRRSRGREGTPPAPMPPMYRR